MVLIFIPNREQNVSRTCSLRKTRMQVKMAQQPSNENEALPTTTLHELNTTKLAHVR